MQSDQPMIARIPARSRRQAMDWGLALVSQDIETTIDCSAEAGWGLLVATQDYERARSVIHQYRVENLHWPWRRKISREGILFDWGSLAWVLLLGLFYWIGEKAADLRGLGLMDGAAVSSGEWWRLFTSVFLHADPGHLASNAGIGLVLLGLTMGRYGTGAGLLATYLAGVGGNLATWLVSSGGHSSLGASGMVMGSLGLLAAQSVVVWLGNPKSAKYILSGIAAGVMLFVLMGLSPGTDIVAHFGGFVTGLLLGSLLIQVPALVENTAINIFAGALFCVLVILTWWVAITRPG